MNVTPELRTRIEAHVGSSNALLSSVDQDIVRELLAEAWKRIDGLDTEVSALQAAITTLRHRRATEMGHIKALHTGIAPHKKLPSELLAKIFVHSLEYDDAEWEASMGIAGPTRMRWALGQICSRWREIVLAEPLLWNRVATFHSDPCSERSMDLVRHVCSHHGGQGKIDLIMWLRHHADWEALLELVSTYPSRIRGLRLMVMDSSHPPSPQDLELPVEAFNLLESLTILDYSGSGFGGIAHTYDIPTTAFSLARDLRKVTLFLRNESAIMPAVSSSQPLRIILPWTQLTDLTIIAISPSACLGIFKQSVQLVNLTVKFSPGKDNHPSPSSFISLPHLRSFSATLNKTHISDFKFFLDALILPALKNIKLGDLGVSFWPQQNVLNLLTRSGNGVESFDQSNLATPGSDVVALMRAMPQLTKFVIHTENGIPEAAFATMNSEKLALKLRIFRVKVSSIRSALEFLANRWVRDEHGRYEGIRDARFYIQKRLLAPDEEYLKGVLPHLQQHGRKVEVKAF